MARTIPAVIDDGVVSSAERRVFYLLDTDPDTSGRTVLHLLGLARRGTGPLSRFSYPSNPILWKGPPAQVDVLCWHPQNQ